MKKKIQKKSSDLPEFLAMMFAVLAVFGSFAWSSCRYQRQKANEPQRYVTYARFLASSLAYRSWKDSEVHKDPQEIVYLRGVDDHVFGLRVSVDEEYLLRAVDEALLRVRYAHYPGNFDVLEEVVIAKEATPSQYVLGKGPYPTSCTIQGCTVFIPTTINTASR